MLVRHRHKCESHHWQLSCIGSTAIFLIVSRDSSNQGPYIVQNRHRILLNRLEESVGQEFRSVIYAVKVETSRNVYSTEYLEEIELLNPS